MKKVHIVTKVVTGRVPVEDAYTKVYITGSIIEMESMDYVPHGIKRFKKLDKFHYLNSETGEALEYHRDQSNIVKQKNMNASFNTLRRLINANFDGGRRELHIVLTYREIMTDKNRLSEDFRCFRDKLKYHYPNCEYIAVSEPQQTGSWHMHILVKDSTGTALYIPQNELEAYWGHGFICVKHITKNNNIGVYFSILHKTLDTIEDSAKADSKKSMKESRLPFYPRNGKLFTTSKGIKHPEPLIMSYKDAMELVGFTAPCYSMAKVIVAKSEEDEWEINTIYYQQFNAKRK
jgi:hypothetical protein